MTLQNYTNVKSCIGCGCELNKFDCCECKDCKINGAQD